jgi:diadenylate cyclase
VRDLFLSFRGLRDVVDIALVTFVLYRVLLIFKGTLALQMLAGLALLMFARFVSHEAGLRSVSFLLDNFWAVWVLALVVLFQPELRRTLAQAGRSRLLQRVFGESAATQHQVVEEVGRAVESLGGKRIGALVALERSGGLSAYAELGVPMDAAVSAELLGSVFQPGSPLHDGAAIIQGGRITAAGCFLPLSRNLQLARTLGTRHRAALGLSEEADAVVVVVSEETGGVSLAVEGRIERMLDGAQLRTRLAELLGVAQGEPSRGWSLLASVRRAREKV